MSAKGMRASVLPVGNLSADLSWLLLDPLKVMADRYHKDKPATWVDIPVHSVFIDHPEAKIIWDCGVPRDWEERWEPTGIRDFWPFEASEDQWLDSRLEQLGYEPGDIDILLLSHLHWDHAGMAADLWKGTNTKVICSAAEYEGAFSYEGYNLGPHVKKDYDGLEYETISEDTELLPGIELLQTPGHTWGTMSLKLDLPDSGPIIFTSDAIYLKENYGPPAIAPAIVQDSRKWFGSVEKIRDVAEKTNAKVIFGHSDEQIREIKTYPEFYT